jgi:hypothetical protein
MAEPPWDRFTSVQTREMQRAEAAFNVFLAHYAARVVCPYSAALPGAILDVARRTHPRLDDGGSTSPSPDYGRPAEVARGLDARAASTRQPSYELRPGFDGSIPRVRSFVAAIAAEHGAGPASADRLLLALTSVLGGALRSGASITAVRCRCDSKALVCELVGHGGAFDDPLAGYRPPDRASGDGLDLWLARQLLDGLALGRSRGDAAFVLEVAV